MTVHQKHGPLVSVATALPTEPQPLHNKLTLDLTDTLTVCMPLNLALPRSKVISLTALFA